jgi:hypothetical protein
MGSPIGSLELSQIGHKATDRGRPPLKEQVESSGQYIKEILRANPGKRRCSKREQAKNKVQGHEIRPSHLDNCGDEGGQHKLADC